MRLQCERLTPLFLSIFADAILLVVGNSILTSIAYKSILNIYSSTQLGINSTLNELDFIEITGSFSRVQFVDLT